MTNKSNAFELSPYIESFCIDALKSTYRKSDDTYLEQFVKSDNDENMMELFEKIFEFFQKSLNESVLENRRSVINHTLTLLPKESSLIRLDNQTKNYMTALSILLARNCKKNPLIAFKYLRYCLVSSYLMLLIPQIDYQDNKKDEQLNSEIDTLNNKIIETITTYHNKIYMPIIIKTINNNNNSQSLDQSAKTLIDFIKEKIIQTYKKERTNLNPKFFLYYNFATTETTEEYLEKLEELLKVLKNIEEKLKNKPYPDGAKLPSAYMLGKACIEMFEKLQQQSQVKDHVIFSIFHAEWENNAVSTLQYDGETTDELNNIDNIQKLIKCCTENNQTHLLPLTYLLGLCYNELWLTDETKGT